MTTNKRTFKLVAILTLMIILPSLAQAQTHKRRSKTQAHPHIAAISNMGNPLLFEDFNKIKVNRLSERQRMFLGIADSSLVRPPIAKMSPSNAALLKTTSSLEIMPRVATTGAGFVTPAITGTHSELIKRLAAETYYPYGNLSSFAKQRCVQSQSKGVGIGAANFGYTSWGDNRYVSISFGPSKPKVSVSSSKGTCEEPSTGFFVNATLATWRKGTSVTWYPGNDPSFERITSTPTIGASAGYTFKIWRRGS